MPIINDWIKFDNFQTEGQAGFIFPYLASDDFEVDNYITHSEPYGSIGGGSFGYYVNMGNINHGKLTNWHLDVPSTTSTNTFIFISNGSGNGQGYYTNITVSGLQLNDPSGRLAAIANCPGVYGTYGIFGNNIPSPLAILSTRLYGTGSYYATNVVVNTMNNGQPITIPHQAALSMAFSSGGYYTILNVLSGLAGIYPNGNNSQAALTVGSYQGMPLPVGVYTNLVVDTFIGFPASTNVSFTVFTNGISTGMTAVLNGPTTSNTRNIATSGTATFTNLDAGVLCQLVATNSSSANYSSYFSWTCSVYR